ncbi:hypothetical protein [Chlorobaculum thiosulfatiphilum]|jgi:hypothetical protein|uniref:hypothetical protein n=1 Tax=Chlorobaculum thiosulfatiphilum TaxID=115852 RepID=UPI0038B300D8
MQFNPCLHQAQLLARQIASQNLPIFETNRGFIFRLSRMKVRSIVMFVIEQIQPDNDSVKH